MNPSLLREHVWVLCDDRPGNNNQALGVAEALGLSFSRIDISYSSAAKLPNPLRLLGLLGISDDSRAKLVAPFPQVVIAAGRRLAPVLHFIKKCSPSTVVVQLMRPNLPLSGFDLVVLPAHDKTGESKGNLLVTAGSPHRVTENKLHESREEWRENFGHFPAPMVSLLVGGDSKHGRFLPEHYRFLGEWCCQLAKGGTLLATTSRRTGEAGEVILREAVTAHPHHYFHDWQRWGSNPYMAMLGWANAIVVTGDSMSMCTEACATGRPVFIYAPEGSVSKKHRRLHETLIAGGYARLLTEETLPLLSGASTPLPNPAEEVAARIQKLLTR